MHILLQSSNSLFIYLRLYVLVWKYINIFMSYVILVSLQFKILLISLLLLYYIRTLLSRDFIRLLHWTRTIGWGTGSVLGEALLNQITNQCKLSIVMYLGSYWFVEIIPTQKFNSWGIDVLTTIKLLTD